MTLPHLEMEPWFAYLYLFDYLTRRKLIDIFPVTLGYYGANEVPTRRRLV